MKGDDVIKTVFYLPESKKGDVPYLIAQAVFGFMKLAHDGILDLTFSKVTDDLPSSRLCFFADVNGYRVCYDIHDAIALSAEQTDDLLNRCDFIFKRSYSTSFAQKLKNRDRYFPYGLQYLYFYQNNNLLTRGIAEAFRLIRGKSKRDLLAEQVKDVDKYWRIRPSQNTDIDILFSARLWDDLSTNAKVPRTGAYDREERNQERISNLRTLRRAFGSRALCGVSDTPIARRLCPDLILPESYTKRSCYRKLVQRSKVCVSTTGLSQSIGVNFSEFISAGKAIVSSPLYYGVLGDLEPGKNYLPFTNSDELIAHCETLLSDERERRLMELNNEYYYMRYVRPDVQVLNHLLKIFEYERRFPNKSRVATL